MSRVAHHAEEFYASSYVLLSPFALASMVALGVLSWGFEVLGFYVVLLGLDGGVDLLLRASFIMPAATLASALLLTPGGLGVAEGGITGLFAGPARVAKGPRGRRNLVIRLGTLWFGVVVGLVALVIVGRSLAERPQLALDGDPSSEEAPTS